MIYQPGDIFCTCAPNIASRMIVNVTAWWSIDCRAEYAHTGVITSAGGETFESRVGGVGKYNISDFAGMPMLVGRHKDMTPERYERAMTPIIEKYDGRAYPWWRIVLHLIPPIARRVGKGDYLVCSEVVTKLLRDSGLYPFARGWNPDNLADMIVYWRDWSIIDRKGKTMFGKKTEDIYAIAKAAAEIAVRRVLANNPKVAVPMKLICSLVAAGEMDDLLTMIADNNPSLFGKDPLLMADIKTILALIGFMDVTLDKPKLEAITGHVCKMI